MAELTDRIGLPDWVPGFAIVLFIIGLPIVLATAIVQKGGPLRRPQSPASSRSDHGYELGSTYERLAELYQTRDRQKAALYAARFVELWQNADAELQPRIEAKRQMLRRLNEAR